MKNILILSFVICLFLNINVFGQKNIAKADDAFNMHQYKLAVDLYTDIFDKIEDEDVKKEVMVKLAECHMALYNYKQAEDWYAKAIKAEFQDTTIFLYYANTLKSQGRYDEALTEYKKYGEFKPDDRRAAKEIKACELAMQWKEKPTRYKVTNVEGINSYLNDYAPTYTDRKYQSIVFSSTRESAGKITNPVDGERLADLFLTALDKKGTKWTEPVKLGENVNTSSIEEAAQINNKGGFIYFTRYNMDKDIVLGSKILMAQKQGLDWAKPEILPIPDIDNSTFIGQPSVSKTDLLLYVSADLPGGFGGKDIYVIVRRRANGMWIDKPINLGSKINTPGDEIYPYIRPDGILYFSSNGRGGMGGFDIFKAKPLGTEPDKFDTPENLQYPINSEAEDISFIIEDAKESGYFSSNRKDESKGGFDIYSFILPDIDVTLTGVVKNKATGKPLAKAYLWLAIEGGSVVEILTDANGVYKFNKTQILKGKEYKLTIGHKDATAKDDFLKTTRKISTMDVVETTNMELNFELVPAN